MDIELVRTFLAIVAAGSFVRAADRLNVSQTAVSARIRTLEAQLRRRLFIRNKGGASLTSAGEQFLRHAPSLVQLWERARQEVAVPESRRAVLSVGAEHSLWDPLLLRWLLWLRRHQPDVALRAHVFLSERVLDQVADGIIDIGIVYAARHRPGLRVELLMEERLVLVRGTAAGIGRDDYVQVDRGDELLSGNAPGQQEPSLVVDLGPLGLGYILEAGGTGYFRLSSVKPHLRSGRLELVPNAPDFLYPAYAVFNEASSDPSLVASALDGLRKIAREEASPVRARRGGRP
ncbi:LysR family transcriptional regulator [Roseomonas terrae]|jgi:DNA-binding transcriptional LysR family regulator|uniref:LysR family transcriptional regulator n=1 Tax=Neoroseomonas terrae TaxID=424799 RepID=A0ABS5EI97_9PROT|nr:LysR family transcriptional regulator [Neoroseomonas terrae]MBR0650716.1 LysR family transcriptional regulator [Neoroseomonas terrae]